MPHIPHHGRSANGVHMFLGANPRPHNPLIPALASVLDPSHADLSQERNLGAMGGKDYRSRVKNQRDLGSCTGATTCEDAEMCARVDGSEPPELSIGFVYEMERRMEGSFPQDAGAFTDDGVTIAAQRGIPADSVHPYDAQAATEYDSQQAEQDAATHKYIASHLSIDVRSPDVLKLIWAALDAKMPCYLETYWYEAFFNPNAIGALPLTYDSLAGGHAISLYGIIPDRNAPGGGYLALANHWTAGWNTQAARYGHAIRAGDFLMPWAMLTATNTPVMHIGAVSPVAVAPQPNPPLPAAKTLNDWIGPWRDTVADPSVDLDEVEMRDWQGSWMDWANGATVMKPGYQLPPPVLPRGRR